MDLYVAAKIPLLFIKIILILLLLQLTMLQWFYPLLMQLKQRVQAHQRASFIL